MIQGICFMPQTAGVLGESWKSVEEDGALVRLEQHYTLTTDSCI